MTGGPATPQEYFDRIYSRSDDPWDFAGSWYENRKYRLLVAALPEQRYEVGFEPASSVGVLTTLLAPRCGELYAVDRSERAAQLAAERTANLPHVHVRAGDALEPWPVPDCDLLVLSEFLYYYPPAELPGVVAALLGLARPGATVAACHWRGHSPDHPSTGDVVHAELRSRPELERLVEHVEEGFVLEVFRRR